MEIDSFIVFSSILVYSVYLCIYSDIKIAALDATTAESIASQYKVTGYPTIKFFPKGSTTPIDYDGGRTADTIVQ